MQKAFSKVETPEGIVEIPEVIISNILSFYRTYDGAALFSDYHQKTLYNTLIANGWQIVSSILSHGNEFNQKFNFCLDDADINFHDGILCSESNDAEYNARKYCGIFGMIAKKVKSIMVFLFAMC